MRRIAILNQKGGVGKTTTAANLGAALAGLGRRVVVVDMDPQANLTLHLGLEPDNERPTTYTVLMGQATFAEALRDTATPGLRVCPSHIDLSGAELELAGAIGRERVLTDALDTWLAGSGEEEPADYLLFDCAPSLGLLTINALTAAREVFVTLQTEFFALQGMSKLIEVVDLLQRRLNPELEVTGILPCLYDSRLRLAREVLAEIRNYFPDKVFRRPIRTNVKLAEAPSYGQHIFEYAPDSKGALDHRALALEVLAQEARLDPRLAKLPRPEPSAAPRASAPPAPAPAPAPASPSTPASRARPAAPTTAAPAPLPPSAGAPPGKSPEKSPAAAQRPPQAPPRAPVPAPARPPQPAAPQARPAPRSWDSPEVGDVVLEPRPRRTPGATRPEPVAEDELPPLPPDALGLEGRSREG